MIRLVIMMSAIIVVGSSGAEAAPRKSAKATTWQTAAVAARPAMPARPAGAAASECYTDDGYGRFWPCSGGPCGR
jgi:hypothetical protein